MSAVRHLACPRCAGVLEGAGETAVSECPYCGVEVLVTVEGAPRRWYAPPVISESQADEAVQACLAASAAPLGYPAICEQSAHRLLFLPFHQLQGTFFIRLEKRDREVDTEASLRPIYMLEPALLDDAYGMQHLGTTVESRTLTSALRPFDPVETAGLGAVFEPDYGPEKLRANMERSLDEVKVRRGVGRELVEARFSLVYLPVWECRYWLEGRAHTAYVDALEGKVLRGRAPESHLGRNFLAHLSLFVVADAAAGVVARLNEASRLSAADTTNLGAVDAVITEGAALALGAVAVVLLLALFRRYLRPPVVEMTDGTFRHAGEDAGLIDGFADVLELLVRTPLAVVQEVFRR